MMGSLRRRRLLLMFGMILAMAFHGVAALADETLDREYRIKAAFVYNFLKFVEGGPVLTFAGSEEGGR